MKTSEPGEALPPITVYAEPGAAVVSRGHRSGLRPDEPGSAPSPGGATAEEAEDPGRDPAFVALIERSRLRQRREGGIPAAEMRRRLGL